MHSRLLIDRYISGNLSSRDEDRARRHLADCASCRSYFDEQIVLLRALSGDVSKPTIAEQERVLRRALREAGFAPTITEAPSKLLDRLPPRMRLYVALGIAVLLLLSLGLWFGRSGQQRRPPAPMLVPPAPVSSQPLPAARLTSAKRVKLQGTPAAAGSVLLAGVPVEVAAGGMGEFRLDRGGRVRVLSRSLALFSAKGEFVELKRGKIWSKIDPHRGTFQVATDLGTARTKSATFIVETTAAGETEVRVVRGSVDVEDTQHRGVVLVKRGQETRLGASSPPTPAKRYAEDRDPDCPFESMFK